MALPPENARKTHCEHDHLLEGENLLLLHRSDGRVERVCRRCARARSRRFHQLHYVPHPRVKKPTPEPKPRTKKPKPEPKPRRRPLLERIEAHLDMDGDCWNWTGAKSNGYGVIQLGRGEGTAKVHRLLYQLAVEPVSDELDISHLCHNRACANPDHLTPATRRENMRESQRAGRLRRRPTAPQP